MSESLVDMKTLIFEFGEDWDIFSELLNDYKNAYGEMLVTIEKAIKDHDSESLRITAHTLKGVVANFYCERLKEAAFHLEQCGRDQDLTQARQRLEDFKKLNLETIKCLDDYSMSLDNAS